MVGGLSYAPAVFYSDPAAITAEALTCNAPSPIAWQQDSTSRAQIDSYLTGFLTGTIICGQVLEVETKQLVLLPADYFP